LQFIINLKGVEETMKILVASRGKNRLSEMPERFGKAENFVIYDTVTKEYSFFENKFREASHGSGVNNIKEIISRDIDVVIVKKLGEKSTEILKHSEIDVYQGEGGYIFEEVDKYLNGKLTKLF
jgi:predicted Fe-Mo cluster-binding NifX family protein